MKKRKGQNRAKRRAKSKGWNAMLAQVERAHKAGKVTKGTRRFFGGRP